MRFVLAFANINHVLLKINQTFSTFLLIKVNQNV